MLVANIKKRKATKTSEKTQIILNSTNFLMPSCAATALVLFS